MRLPPTLRPVPTLLLTVLATVLGGFTCTEAQDQSEGADGGAAAATNVAAAPIDPLHDLAQELLRVRASDLPDERRVDFDGVCSDGYADSWDGTTEDIACPTLEETMARDQCLSFAVGCGLVEVRGDRDVYWYEGFAAAPVGWVSTAGADIGQLLWAATVPLECHSLEAVCDTCIPALSCESLLEGLPQPPRPQPTPGCACDSGAAGDSHVSLECFCSVYHCPEYAEFLLDCPVSPSRGFAARSATLSCGEVWFASGQYTGQRFAYDAETGELIAAMALSNGPVTAPCGSQRVIAGAARDCSTPQSCKCNVYSDHPDACGNMDWFAASLQTVIAATPPVSSPPPDDTGPSISIPWDGCRFDYLGDWIRCENAGWPNVVSVAGDSLEDCMVACLERADCTAVTDWYWLGRPDLGCSLYISSCDAPSGGVWQEEDAGKEYHKVCPG